MTDQKPKKLIQAEKDVVEGRVKPFDQKHEDEILEIIRKEQQDRKKEREFTIRADERQKMQEEFAKEKNLYSKQMVMDLIKKERQKTAKEILNMGWFDGDSYCTSCHYEPNKIRERFLNE